MKNQLSQEVVSILEDYGVEITPEIVAIWNTPILPQGNKVVAKDFVPKINLKLKSPINPKDFLGLPKLEEKTKR